ncbi:GtrA family protein [Candidatus Saccharibacteria bacterium]|nr:GtrA family protein [Candidatus Saccharibacteria bacterium]
MKKDSKLPLKLVKNHTEIAQVGRFGLVGILNTLVDFVVLNILVATLLPKTLVIFSISLFGNTYNITGPILAGIISGTAAMINSFVFNKNFTFKAKKLATRKLAMFFVITAFGLCIIRPIILYIFSDVWLWPSQLAYNISSWLHLPFSRDFTDVNLALVAAIAVVLVYNYLMYKYYIFKNEDKK